MSQNTTTAPGTTAPCTIGALETAAGITDRTAFWMRFAGIRGTFERDGKLCSRALEAGIAELRRMAAPAAAVAAAALAGCAQGPDSIAPVALPPGMYDATTCAATAAERSAAAERLAALEAGQRGAVAGDAVGVLLIGVPVASLTGGDKAGLIALEKGKIVALDARLASCARA